MLWLLIGVVVVVVVVASMAARTSPRDRPLHEHPSANNPDAFEADLDPEGDEPEGY